MKERLLEVIKKWLYQDDDGNWVRETGLGQVVLDGDFNIDKLADMLVEEISKPVKEQNASDDSVSELR